MREELKDILESEGGCLSTDLTRILVDDHGLTEEAARKRVSRGSAGIKRLAYLVFPRKARFIYLEQDFGSPGYWNGLKSAILKSNSSYAPALSAMIQRDGVIRKSDFQIVCGSPIRQKKHLAAETVLTRLTQAHVVKEIDVAGVGLCVVLTEAINNGNELDLNKFRARLITEEIVLKAVKTWIRNLGLASYEKVAIRGDAIDAPKVGTFAWDLTGPSYLSPLVDWSDAGQKKPGFITCDVLLGTEIDENGISPFLRKCQTLNSLQRIGRCLHVFVADNYSKSAFKAIKDKGYIPATPVTLFGEDVAKGLTQLTAILVQAAHASVRPEVFNELFNGLGRIEGVATNLRGTLFEFIVAELARQILGATVSLNKAFKDEHNNKAEVDVVAIKSNRSIHFIECKGYQPAGTLEDADIERWLKNRIPLIRKQAMTNSEWRNLEFHFELWTTGRFTEEAITSIEAAKKITKKYTIDYLDATRVAACAAQSRDPSLIATINQHFLMHPLATVEKKVDQKIARTNRTQKTQPGSPS